MPFWSRGPKEGQSRQLPSTMVAKEFGEVNVMQQKGEMTVNFSVLMKPEGSEAENWQTGVAIDASGSMKPVFGRGLVKGRTDPPNSLWQEYLKKGWMVLVPHQGQQVPVLSDQAEYDLVNRGHFTFSQNSVEPLARKFTSYLASELDEDGGTTVIYWACGDGNQIEVIGDLTSQDCEATAFKGPQGVSFGNSTMLTPAVRYFADRFRDAKRGLYIFITDGVLNDLPQVKHYTTELCKDIQAKRRNPIKCILIGIGDQVDEDQMEELDDLDTGTGVDVWDHKIAKEMRDMTEIFAELVSENQIVAPTGRVYDESGKLVLDRADGLHAKESFKMPATSRWFELEVGGRRIRQSVVLPK